MKKLSIQAQINGLSVTIRAKPAQTLMALLKKGSKGITSLEMSNTWALRLAAYVFELRHKYGLEIAMEREEHEGGWHARYILITPVQVVA